MFGVFMLIILVLHQLVLNWLRNFMRMFVQMSSKIDLNFTGDLIWFLGMCKDCDGTSPV
jgi:hypothetical protein